EDDRGVPRNAPVPTRFDVGEPCATLTHLATRPEDSPQRAGGGAEEKLGWAIVRDVATEVHYEEPVAASLSEEAQDEGLGPEHRSVEPARPLGAQHRILP